MPASKNYFFKQNKA